MPALFRALRLPAGAFVPYPGVRTAVSMRQSAQGAAEPVPEAVQPPRQGFVTNVLNPKASQTPFKRLRAVALRGDRPGR
ncbi:hypothetical protein GQF42_08625 [Streptomyces broussonetiae]|uniref:Uncharacterized protein n=1 Tax=Streptomyces broussonetiae TaxID=2686304 RepID=A0A6I6N075_9ACTN|nr:hypothetical protein [Streptomyces broussonetiae]QHA03320.1 hypothetical protein GQF42_08625 [Streptomyces broussonetiae]